MKLFATSLLLGAATVLTASNPQLVVEKVDNGGIVPGQTFRVYAELPSPQHSLHAVFGDSQDALSIHSTSGFYQHPMGNFSSADIHPLMVNNIPALAYDTWVTIGAEDASSNNLWNVGIDFDGFEAGAAFSTENGAWFLIPTDQRTSPVNGNLVLLMQITTEGVASGVLNVQGWDQEGMPWQGRALTFVTTNSFVFGCTNVEAPNYAAEATYDDGTCLPATDQEIVSVGEINGTTEQSMMVFPNPIWDGQFNLQFANKVELRNENLIVEIFDGAGKRVLAEEITSGAIIGGNRIIIRHQLASGTYTLSARATGISLATQIVVTR